MQRYVDLRKEPCNQHTFCRKQLMQRLGGVELDRRHFLTGSGVHCGWTKVF